MMDYAAHAQDRDIIAQAVASIVRRHLNDQATTSGVNAVAELDRAVLHRWIDKATDRAVDVWLTTTPVSRGGLVLDRDQAAT